MDVTAVMVVLAGIQAGLALRAYEIGSRFVAGVGFVACIFTLGVAIARAAHETTLLTH